jgi:predicted nucleic acid-binding protein
MVLVDNTVLSNFARVFYLVLPDMSLDFEVLKLREEELELYNSLRVKLGKGEASCLAIAKNCNMKILTDDSDARKVANILGVPVSGTIGVLVRCVEKNIISKEEGNQILKEMIVKGFYSPISDLDEIV